MFCPKCGKELPQNAAFCPQCGVQLTQNRPHILEQGSGVMANGSAIGEYVGKNQSYYLQEFGKIEAGQKSKFNWAAFLLGPAMCAYRRCGRLFLRYFLLPMVICLIGMPLGQIGVGTFNLVLSMIGSVLVVGGGIYALVSDILFALHFNRNYRKQCLERLAASVSGKQGVSKTGLVAYYVAVLFYGIISAVIVSAVIAGFWSELSEIDDVPTYTEPDISWQISEPFSGEDDTISQPLPVEPEEPTESVDGPFDSFVGNWQDELGNGFGLWIGYEDETKQRAYAYVATAAGDFEVELTLDESGSVASGTDMGYGSEPLFAIDISRIGYKLETSLYYGELGFSDYINFVPADPESVWIENPYYTG
ncbi:zinc ribbon domain-containing protein [uncultured Flavonifractor sp.]|uniref:zinc ribbon domain-containing protein n=1 Tax=uncultured Flavonifractor sp. TaxID=1193534 RepID=UPI002591EC27|nr:zinc ribbon domain-containing protein [uncultured Flavonifractor sp.]